MTDAEFSDRLERLISAFENSIDRLGGSISRSSGSLGSLAGSLNSTNRSLSKTEQAFEQLTGMTMSATSAEKLKVQVGAQVVDLFKNLVVSSRRAVASMYGAESGLSSFASTLDDMKVVFGDLGNILQLSFAATLTPAGIAAAGIIKRFGGVLGEATEQVKLQLRLMDQQLSYYKSVNESGAMFGGTLANMQVAAQQVGVGLPDLAKVVNKTRDDLANLGFGISHSSTLVAQQAATITRSDKAMLNLYGSFDELAKGTASYMALQAQLGNTQIGNLDAQRNGTRDFLLRQKELAEITGKRIDQLKAEETERRKNLAYSSKLARLPDVARQNVADAMALSGKLFTEEGAAYAKEYFATGGQVFSREALLFAANNREAAETIQSMLANINESKEVFRTRTGDVLEAARPALENFAKNMETFSEINFGANNPILTSMTRVASAILENATLLNNTKNIFKSMAEEEEKRRLGVRITGEGKEEIDRVAEVIHTMEKTRLDNQLTIDKMINDNFGKMQNVITVLAAAQFAQIKLTDAMTSAASSTFDIVASPIANLINKIKGFDPNSPNSQQQTNAIQEAINQLPTPPAGPAGPSGGPGTGPATQPTSTSGAGSSSTVNISNLVNLMNSQVTQTNDLLRIQTDSRDLLQRLVNSSQ